MLQLGLFDAPPASPPIIAAVRPVERKPSRPRVQRLVCGCEEREWTYPAGSLCDVGEWLLQDKNEIAYEQGKVARGEATERPSVSLEWMFIHAQAALVKHLQRAWIDPGPDCTLPHGLTFGECLHGPHANYGGVSAWQSSRAMYEHHGRLRRMKPQERDAYERRCSSAAWNCEVGHA